MRMYDLIKKKRDGGELDEEEISFFIEGMMDGTIPDYQVSALLMAIYFRGMSYGETLRLTLAMAGSGDILNLDRIEGSVVDKHSTGGVGDKTTLVLAPMAAACGLRIAKMSGRGLGYTGGTIDKLECFSGFSASLSEDEFISQVNSIGLAITGQTANLAPADKKLYALRDVTAAVDSLPLIASSIMSKKLAAGAKNIVLDVKCGSGAFMKTESAAMELARVMTDIGRGAGRKTVALVTDMSQPLGFAVGNTLEVIEAIETLKGRGPEDLTQLCLRLGTQMLTLARPGLSRAAAEDMLEKTLKDGSALRKFCEFVEAQGGDVLAVTDYDKFAKAAMSCEVKAAASGYVAEIMTEEIGRAVMLLGGGREKKGDGIDPAVGIILKRKIADEVALDTTIAEVYANDGEKMKTAAEIIKNAYVFSEVCPEKRKTVIWAAE